MNFAGNIKHVYISLGYEPVIIIIALVGAAIADSVDKKKRKKRQFSKPEKSDIEVKIYRK